MAFYSLLSLITESKSQNKKVDPKHLKPKLPLSVVATAKKRRTPLNVASEIHSKPSPTSRRIRCLNTDCSFSSKRSHSSTSLRLNTSTASLEVHLVLSILNAVLQAVWRINALPSLIQCLLFQFRLFHFQHDQLQHDHSQQNHFQHDHFRQDQDRQFVQFQLRRVFQLVGLLRLLLSQAFLFKVLGLLHLPYQSPQVFQLSALDHFL